MGFLGKSTMQGGKYVVETMRTNAKNGFFSVGSADFGSKQMECSFLGFKKIGNVVLFPFEPDKNEKAKEPKSTAIITLRKGNKVYSTLVRTYNVGRFENFMAEIDAYNSDHNTDYDISDFLVTMSFKKNPKKTDYYIVEYQWGVANGKPSRYKIDGETVEGFKPNLLDKEGLSQNEEISKNLALPMDICREYVRWNTDNGESVLQTEHGYMWTIAAAVKMNLIEKEDAKALIESTETDIKFLSESVTK